MVNYLKKRKLKKKQRKLKIGYKKSRKSFMIKSRVSVKEKMTNSVTVWHSIYQFASDLNGFLNCRVYCDRLAIY